MSSVPGLFLTSKANCKQRARIDRGDPQRPLQVVTLDPPTGHRRQPSATSQVVGYPTRLLIVTMKYTSTSSQRPQWCG
jgi:hypothetical protein